MNADPTPYQPDPSRLDKPPGTLAERITLAEQRLIAREENLRVGIARLTSRARDAMQPKRLLAPLFGSGAALAGLGLLKAFSGGATRSTKTASSSAAAGAGGKGGKSGGSRVPWVRLATLGWPLVPAQWRSRVSPATATTVLTIAPPLLEALLGSKPSPLPPLRTAVRVNLRRYAGRWYEIARLPAPFESACDGQPAARYIVHATSRGTLLEVVNSCPKRNGGERTARGVARPVRGAGGAKLRLSLLPRWLRWLPFGWSDYWIIDVDASYSSALVGSPKRDFLWVLSRSPSLSETRLRELVDLAHDQGFPVERLRLADER